MRKVHAFVSVGAAIALALTIGGCSSQQQGLLPLPVHQPQALRVMQPGNVRVGEPATFRATWLTGQPPFQVSWRFNTGANPDYQTLSVPDRESLVTVDVVNGDGLATFPAAVEVLDDYGQVAVLQFSVAVQ